MDDVHKNGYWIANEDRERAWSMLRDGMAIRIAKKSTFEPNMEMFERYLL